MQQCIPHGISLGHFKLKNFAIVACFDIVRMSGKKPVQLLWEGETTVLNTASSHSNYGKAEMQSPDANVCKSTVPKSATHKHWVDRTRHKKIGTETTTASLLHRLHDRVDIGKAASRNYGYFGLS